MDDAIEKFMQKWIEKIKTKWIKWKIYIFTMKPPNICRKSWDTNVMNCSHFWSKMRYSLTSQHYKMNINKIEDLNRFYIEKRVFQSKQSRIRFKNRKFSQIDQITWKKYEKFQDCCSDSSLMRKIFTNSSNTIKKLFTHSVYFKFNNWSIVEICYHEKKAIHL